MNSMRFTHSISRRLGFTLIEVVLALGVFLVAVLALIGLLAPMLKSVDEIEKLDEITSVVNSVNAFLQSSPEIAVRQDGQVTQTKFNAIYEAVTNDGFATLLVFRQYSELVDGAVNLKIGFWDETNAKIVDNDITDGVRVKAAGPIFRVILTPASVMPIDYYNNTTTNADGATVPARNDAGVYEFKASFDSVDAYLEGYFAMEARIFAENPSLNFKLATLPDGKSAGDLLNFKDKEPDFVFNTAIVR